MNSKPPTAFRHAANTEALEARFAYRIAARLDEQSQNTPHDVSERLRFARDRAMERARLARTAAAPAAAAAVVSSNGGLAATLSFGGRPSLGGWWMKFAGVLPLIALAAGLVLIQEANWRAQIDAAAEIDAALLTDDLPPDAYSDPGFTEFLKNPGN